MPMCIIAYKPEHVNFPGKKTLRRCFDNNDDGAGYMFADGREVHILKGFMTFDKFWKSLKESRQKYGEDIPYVMHFRIGTQGGNTKDLTHPFPLSEDMNELRKVKDKCEIGIAHNGIIDLTTSYSKKVDYSDTMKFITDYLSLIITNMKYYREPRTLRLIKELAGSKLAILDKNKHCELIGEFIEENGIYYSNYSYRQPRYTGTTAVHVPYSYDWDDYDDYGAYGYWPSYGSWKGQSKAKSAAESAKTFEEKGSESVPVWEQFNEKEPLSFYNCWYESHGDHRCCEFCDDKVQCWDYDCYLKNKENKN